jgi:phage terminase large subunit
VASYWHCLPEYEQGRKGLWNAINAHTGKRRIDEAFPPEIRDSKTSNEMFIRFKCGSTWQVIGSDRYDATVGAGVAGIVYSEWALANPSAWGYTARCWRRTTAGPLSSPRRAAGTMPSHVRHGKANPSWFAEVSTVHDTGALSPAQLEESLIEYIALYGEDVGRAQFEQEYLCSFNAAILGALLRPRDDGAAG